VSETRKPVRHGSRTRRPTRLPPAFPPSSLPPSSLPPSSLPRPSQPPSRDLQAVFAALALRSKLPTRPGTRAADVLRIAGLPLLLAALVASTPFTAAAGAQRTPGSAAAGSAHPHPGTPGAEPRPPAEPAAAPDPALGAPLRRTYPPDVAAAAQANRRTLATATLPTKEQARATVVALARAMGVNPALALAVAYQESGFDQRRVSAANAVGLMQLTPSAGRWAGALIGRHLDLLDTKDNITAGLTLLQVLTRSSPEPEAIAGYYQGLSSVRAQGMYDDTRRFVAAVRTLKARFAAGR